MMAIEGKRSGAFLLADADRAGEAVLGYATEFPLDSQVGFFDRMIDLMREKKRETQRMLDAREARAAAAKQPK